MKKEKTKKTWVDYEGNVVPESAISPFDKKKEPKMQQMAKRLQSAYKSLSEAQNYIKENADALMTEMYANRGQEFSKEESYTLYSYDKAIKLECRKTPITELTPEINIARKMFEEYVETNLPPKASGIRQLVYNGFSKKNGDYSTDKMLNLLSLDIKDSMWLKACEVLRSCITTKQSKRAFYLSVRDGEGEYISVNLNNITKLQQ